MGWVQTCDLCNEVIIDNKRNFADTMHAKVDIFNFNDGYNSDDKDITLHICHNCLMKKFSKKEVLQGTESGINCFID